MQEQLIALDDLLVALSTIHNAIVGFHFSFKVLKKQVEAAVTPALLELRRVYAHFLSWTIATSCT